MKLNGPIGLIYLKNKITNSKITFVIRSDIDIIDETRCAILESIDFHEYTKNIITNSKIPINIFFDDINSIDTSHILLNKTSYKNRFYNMITNTPDINIKVNYIYEILDFKFINTLSNVINRKFNTIKNITDCHNYIIKLKLYIINIKLIFDSNIHKNKLIYIEKDIKQKFNILNEILNNNSSNNISIKYILYLYEHILLIENIINDVDKYIKDFILNYDSSAPSIIKSSMLPNSTQVIDYILFPFNNIHYIIYTKINSIIYILKTINNILNQVDSASKINNSSDYIIYYNDDNSFTLLYMLINDLSYEIINTYTVSNNDNNIFNNIFNDKYSLELLSTIKNMFLPNILTQCLEIL